jgi:hypothetical protein
MEYPSVTAELRLALSVKAMNDCVGPEGLVPSLLVFGVMPRLPDLPRQIPSQIGRFKCLYKGSAGNACVCHRHQATTYYLGIKLPCTVSV